jgi:hypothetical protein
MRAQSDATDADRDYGGHSARMPAERSVVQQYAAATATGAIFGATNTIVGHPFDTVKTKMQAQSGFRGSMGTAGAVAAIWRAEGIGGFYRGCLPPMWGITTGPRTLAFPMRC